MKTAHKATVNVVLRDECLRTMNTLAVQIAEWVRQEPEQHLKRALL